MTADRPTPEARALQGCAGTPAILSDGRAWLLRDGGLTNDLDDLRDRIDDQARLSGTIPLSDVGNAALHLLLANYDLTLPEATDLIIGAVDQRLADAVLLALFGPLEGRRTYTNWAASALIANGIDPDRVPSALMPHVLAHLEQTKRCIPREEYIESAEASRRLAGIRAMAVKAEPVAEAQA